MRPGFENVPPSAQGGPGSVRLVFPGEDDLPGGGCLPPDRAAHGGSARPVQPPASRAKPASQKAAFSRHVVRHVPALRGHDFRRKFLPSGAEPGCGPGPVPGALRGRLGQSERSLFQSAEKQSPVRERRRRSGNSVRSGLGLCGPAARCAL